MRGFCLIFLIFLAGCTSGGGTLTAPETGLTGAYTHQMVISDHPHHILTGHLIDATRDGVRTRALVIGHRRDGVHRLRMSEAWSAGVELPFTASHRRLAGCTHGHCRDRAVGMIFLSEALFDRARTTGLSARLIGQSDAIDIHVPPALFTALQE